MEAVVYESVRAQDEHFSVTPQMKAVLDYLAEYGEMKEEELQELLNVKRTRAYLVARQMCEADLIVATGRGANKKYRLK